MKAGIGLLIGLSVILGLVGWAFLVLLRTEPTSVSEDEAAKMRDDLLESLGSTPDSEVAIAAAGHQLQSWIAPFHKTFPSILLAPHKPAATVGLIGILLTVGGLAWCVLVPKVYYYDAVSTSDVHKGSTDMSSSIDVLESATEEERSDTPTNE